MSLGLFVSLWSTHACMSSCISAARGGWACLSLLSLPLSAFTSQYDDDDDEWMVCCCRRFLVRREAIVRVVTVPPQELAACVLGEVGEIVLFFFLLCQGPREVVSLSLALWRGAVLSRRGEWGELRGLFFLWNARDLQKHVLIPLVKFSSSC